MSKARDGSTMGRIAAVLDLVDQFGGIDGAHHKQWLIDQMLRALLGPEYSGWRRQWDATLCADGEPIEPWDEGRAP